MFTGKGVVAERNIYKRIDDEEEEEEEEELQLLWLGSDSSPLTSIQKHTGREREREPQVTTG